MTDDPSAVPVPPYNGGPQGLRRYSVPQAARILGISERAVRKRIDGGTVEAERDGTRWLVVLPEPIGGTEVPRGTDGGTTSDATAVSNGTAGGTDAVPVTELLSMLNRLQQRNEELAGQLGYLQ